MSTQPTPIATRVSCCLLWVRFPPVARWCSTRRATLRKQEAHLVVTATAADAAHHRSRDALTLFFAWKYREAPAPPTSPEWHHSTKLELVIWAAPLMIIIALGSSPG
jgi:cytochrome o ubiquinol oxidase subunit 2